MARNAATDVQRFAWPRVAAEVMEAYEDAIATPEPQGAARRAAVRIGARAADLKPPAPARRLPSLEPKTQAGRRAGAVAIARRVGCWRCRRSGLPASPRRCCARARRSCCSASA
jgi:phosphatidylinositol alpha-mannosyltransferase